MVTKTLKKETSELIISVIADKKVWKEHQAKAEKDLLANVIVKGFRKGKVPADIAKKSVSQVDIFSKSVKSILNTLVKEASTNIKDEIILDSPSYNVKKLSDVDLEVDFIYPIYPEIKISSYKNLGIKFKIIKEDSSTTENEIQKLQEQHALLIDKAKIAKGDIVNLDFEGSVDGKTFDGGKGQKFDLEIGSKRFVPGFEDQMIGLKKGEHSEISVTFPKDYHVEKLQNKKAIFKVVVNSIKEKQLPKLDSKFVEELDLPNVKTLEELTKYIQNLFKEQNMQKSRIEFQKKVFTKIKEKTSIVLPLQLLIKEMKFTAKQFEDNLKKQGLDKNKYMKLSGIDQVALDAQFKIQAEERLKDSLIFAEISKAEKIELTDKDYEKEYKKLSKIYFQAKKPIKEMITKEQMQMPMTNDRVIDLLIKYNQ